METICDAELPRCSSAVPPSNNDKTRVLREEACHCRRPMSEFRSFEDSERTIPENGPGLFEFLAEEGGRLRTDIEQHHSFTGSRPHNDGLGPGRSSQLISRDEIDRKHQFRTPEQYLSDFGECFWLGGRGPHIDTVALQQGIGESTTTDDSIELAREVTENSEFVTDLRTPATIQKGR